MATAESQIFSKTAHVNTDDALTRIYRLSRLLGSETKTALWKELLIRTTFVGPI